MDTSRVRLNGGRQDGRMIALKPSMANWLSDAGEGAVVWRDQQQVWVMHDVKAGEAFLREDNRTHRDDVDSSLTPFAESTPLPDPPARDQDMTSDVVLTLARVIRDRSWLDQQMTVADDLAAELHRRAAERGLVISAFTDLAVVPSDSGTWARFTLGATAS